MTKISNLVFAATALALAACSNTPGPGETASFQKQITNDPDTRVMQLAWNTARAEKCGFQFNAGKMRSSYLAWEGELGATPEEIARYASAYDQSSSLFKAKIKAEPAAEYCTKPVVNDIRDSVTQYVAGDFSVRQIYKRPVIVVQEKYKPATEQIKEEIGE